VPQERGDEFTPGIFVGQPFTAIGRIGDMAVLGFGEGVSWDAPSGTGPLTGSRYALHVMCPFRVTQGAERIVVGSEDLRRADGPRSTAEPALSRVISPGRGPWSTASR
jgi:hypothetical protein